MYCTTYGIVSYKPTSRAAAVVASFVMVTAFVTAIFGMLIFLTKSFSTKDVQKHRMNRHTIKLTLIYYVFKSLHISPQDTHHSEELSVTCETGNHWLLPIYKVAHSHSTPFGNSGHVGVALPAHKHSQSQSSCKKNLKWEHPYLDGGGSRRYGHPCSLPWGCCHLSHYRELGQSERKGLEVHSKLLSHYISSRSWQHVTELSSYHNSLPSHWVVTMTSPY